MAPEETGTTRESGRRTLVRETVLDARPQEVFDWHERAGAIERLAPPWEPVRVEHAAGGLGDGNRTVFRTSNPGPVALRWIAEHTGYNPPHEFNDTQVSGPFASWHHRHLFDDAGSGRTRLTDSVTCALPCTELGTNVAWPLVRSRLNRMFTYRHRQLAEDLAMHQRAEQRGAGTLHVAIAGASGLIGSQLVALLTSGGHRVSRLVRRAPADSDEIAWDPQAGSLDAEQLRGVDAVVNLAGAPLATRWTPAAKRRIRDSRVQGTRLLAEAVAGLDDGPRVFVCASGINAYGHDRGDRPLTEDDHLGKGFLADVVRDWEAAAQPARDAGLRVVHLRTGLVQSPRGGVLGLQLPLFHLGLGGRLGSGRQWTSWIGIDDIVGLYHHALTTPEVTGAVNAAAPHPVRNAEFTRVLGEVLGRPTPLPVPGLAPTVLLGEQAARETALVNLRVDPDKATQTGYHFRHPALHDALTHVLGRQ